MNEKFTQHIRVAGMTNYIKERNEGIPEEIINSLVDPANAEIDHSDISKGVGLVLCSAATARLRSRETILLKDSDIILEPTTFGTTISGKVPESLRSQVETVCNKCLDSFVYSFTYFPVTR